MNDLLIKEARLLDGGIVDIVVKEGKIHDIGAGIGDHYQIEQQLDLAKKYYISAGWIDVHTHCYPDSPIYHDQPDLVGVAQGVTTVIDAGSVGADDAAHFHSIAQQCSTNVYSLLNISRIGLITQSELADMKNIDADAFRQTVKNHPEFIVGMKARMSKSVVGENGLEPLRRAKEMQKEHGLPLMVHIGNNPPELDDVADLLDAGDIITHCYHSKPNKILTEDGILKPSIQRALARGVILDVGHGRESFSFSVAEQAMRIGTYPDIISSDIYHHNRINGPVHSLAVVMSKLLSLNFSADRIIDCVTKKAAQILHLQGKGELTVGADADLTIFDIRTEQVEWSDANGEVRTGDKHFVPVAAIVAGKGFVTEEGRTEYDFNL